MRKIIPVLVSTTNREQEWIPERMSNRIIRHCYVKEARNSFAFFQTNKHILSLDTVRVIISSRNFSQGIKYPL